MAKHRFKSIDGAVRRIRELEKLVDQYKSLTETITSERRLLAKLASTKPEFNNPLVAIEAEKIRDRILRGC